MAIIRVNKTKNYSVMSNYHLKDKKLSLKAKGLLSVMLSLPEDWDFSIGGLVAICKENETAITSALKELKENGYLNILKLSPSETKSGRFEYVYDIFEQPLEKQGVENLGLENLGLNKINNNKILNNNFNFTEKTQKAVDLWLNYKKEKKQAYKKIGLNSLMKQIQRWQDEFGEDFVEQSVINSINNNYSGLFEPKKQQTKKFNYENRNYSKEDLKNIFTDLDTLNF